MKKKQKKPADMPNSMSNRRGVFNAFLIFPLCKKCLYRVPEIKNRARHSRNTTTAERVLKGQIIGKIIERSGGRGDYTQTYARSGGISCADNVRRNRGRASAATPLVNCFTNNKVRLTRKNKEKKNRHRKRKKRLFFQIVSVSF